MKNILSGKFQNKNNTMKVFLGLLLLLGVVCLLVQGFILCVIHQ